MYLLAMTMLIIGVLGTYTQVLTLQASRLAASQKSFAEAMVQWHSNALAQAQNNMGPSDLTSAGAGGCSLTYALTKKATIPSCTNSTTLSVYVYNASAAAPTAANHYANGGQNTSPGCDANYNEPLCKTSLPGGFSTSYQFYSVAYQVSISGQPQNYVITFLLQPTTTPPFLVMPDMTAATAGQATSFTMADLSQQIKNTGLALASYGNVTTTSAGKFVVTSYLDANNQPVQYAIPTALSGLLSDNTLAIVSSPDAPHCRAGHTYHADGTCS